MLGEHIRDLRKKQGLTQQDFANNLNARYGLNIERSMISKWETGFQEPTMYNVSCIADFFGVSIDYLNDGRASVYLVPPKITDKEVASMDDRTKITIERIKAAREKQKMSYQDISDITGFSKSVLQRYETGAVKKIPIDRLEKIALALSVPPEWLMGYDTTMRDIPISDNIIPLPKTKMIEKETGKRIKYCREKAGETLEQIGELVNVHKTTVMRWENGDTGKIGLPVIEVLANHFNVSSGWLSGKDVPMRDIPLSDNIIPLPKTKKVPLLGAIACGEPILAVENIDKYVEMPETVGGTFALKCKGDSMINARIFDGDIVYIRQQSDVDNGDIAAVLIGEEATLKRVFKYPSKIVLRPENPMYEDLTYNNEELDQIRILGKAVAFLSAIR